MKFLKSYMLIALHIFFHSTKGAKPGTIMRKIGDKILQCNDRCRLTNTGEMVQNVVEGNFVAIFVI